MAISGTARLGKVTKHLAPTLIPGDIAVIAHEDIDRVSAEMLVKTGIKAIVNAEKSATGSFPNVAPLQIIQSGVALVDCVGMEIFDILEDGDRIEVDGPDIKRDGKVVATGHVVCVEEVRDEVREATSNVDESIDEFVVNTAEYLKQERGHIIYNPDPPMVQTKLSGRHVLVVARGPDYEKDLHTLKSYISEMKPAIIAVDGGADAVIEEGYEPDIIVGDMDSVSDEALEGAPEIIAHAYEDGTCPSAARLDELGVEYKIWPLAATSEDLALLLAWENDADLIVAVGTHSNYIEYMEKGRPGMASTFLVRLKVGTKLVDAKGVSKLYRPSPPYRYTFFVICSALIAIFAVILISSPLQNTLRVMWLTLMTNLGI